MTPNLQIRPARPEDHEQLVALWERSVRATHDFLTDSDIVSLRPQAAEELAGAAVDWWVLVSPAGTIAGFLGYTSGTIEGLFIDPDHRRQGAGRLLVAHAQVLAAGPLAVDVNEGNTQAIRAYQALGFSVVARSPTDGEGRPFPILHMKRAAPPAPPIPAVGRS